VFPSHEHNGVVSDWRVAAEGKITSGATAPYQKIVLAQGKYGMTRAEYGFYCRGGTNYISALIFCLRALPWPAHIVAKSSRLQLLDIEAVENKFYAL
jgi:hypothetical protein